MEEYQDFFEISDTGNFVRITPLQKIYDNVELDWDKNWIKVNIGVKSGAFSGNYSAEIMTIDFLIFKKQMSYLYNNLKGVAEFEDVERYLSLKIKGDGIGHFEVNCTATDKPGVNASTLEFDLFFDQTQIPKMVRQLDIIIAEFPVIGNSEIKGDCNQQKTRLIAGFPLLIT